MIYHLAYIIIEISQIETWFELFKYFDLSNLVFALSYKLCILFDRSIKGVFWEFFEFILHILIHKWHKFTILNFDLFVNLHRFKDHLPKWNYQYTKLFIKHICFQIAKPESLNTLFRLLKFIIIIWHFVPRHYS